MNERKFSNAMSELDLKYVEEAFCYKRKTKRFGPVGWGVLAACLCLIVSGVLLYEAENRYPVEVLPEEPNYTQEIAKLPHWEEMEIYQQYDEISVGSIAYRASRGEVLAQQLGAEIGDATASGWDFYAEISGKDARRYCSATVYEIQNIASACAVAVRYEGSDNFYAAVNTSYRPETLGELIEDLDLRNNLTVNCAYYNYQKPLSGYATVRFDNVSPAKVWDLLLSEEGAVNEYDDRTIDRPKSILDLSVSVPIFGYENISITVCENGYIITNIFSTGKMFHVGEESTEAFIDYVLHECEGHEIINSQDLNSSAAATAAVPE